jgi:hypothetical protein
MIPHVKIHLWLGVSLEIIGIAIGIALLANAVQSNPWFINLILFFTSFLMLWYFPHSLAHFAVGRFVGIRFSHYYLSVSGMSRIDNSFLAWSGKLMPMLGVKIVRSSLNDVTPRRRVAMYSSGVIVSLLAPLLCVYTAFSIAEYLSALLLFTALIGNGLFTIYFSSKVGDLSRAKKSRSIPLSTKV